MGVTSPGPPPPQDAPPPQDVPPPQGSFPSQDKKAEPATRWQLSSHLRQLLSSSELEVTTHDVFSKDGRKRVSVLCCLFTATLHGLTLVYSTWRVNIQGVDNIANRMS